jgi:hypothetical protein
MQLGTALYLRESCIKLLQKHKCQSKKYYAKKTGYFQSHKSKNKGLNIIKRTIGTLSACKDIGENPLSGRDIREDDSHLCCMATRVHSMLKYAGKRNKFGITLKFQYCPGH